MTAEKPKPASVEDVRVFFASWDCGCDSWREAIAPRILARFEEMREEITTLQRQQAQHLSFLGWVSRAMDRESVSEFAESFPTIRRVVELVEHFDQARESGQILADENDKLREDNPRGTRIRGRDSGWRWRVTKGEKVKR